MAGKQLPPAAALVLAPLAVLGILVAGVLTVVGHVDPDPSYDPLTLTVSDYAVSDRGGAVDLATVTLGLSSLALLAGLYAVRAPVRALPAVLLLVWTAGLVACAAVPTDPPGAQMTAGGHVHRYAALAAFVSLPLAALVLSRRFDRDPRWCAAVRPIRRLTIAVGIGLLANFYVAVPGDRVLMGLVERLLITAEVGLLALLAVRLRRVAAELSR